MTFLANDYGYSPLLNKTRLKILKTAIQYKGYTEVLRSLLVIHNTIDEYYLKTIVYEDIKKLFFPYDVMITSSGHFYSDYLSMYV